MSLRHTREQASEYANRALMLMSFSLSEPKQQANDAKNH